MRLKDIVNVFSEAAHEVSTKSNDEFPTLVKYNNVLYMKKFKNQISICDYTKKMELFLFMCLLIITS